MKITPQLIRSKSNRPLSSTECLDLSDLGIGDISKLRDACPRLQILNLRNNDVDHISQSLESLRHLWKIDLCNNQVSNVIGLTRFTCLGTLNLANNRITWSELLKLRNVHILDLSLHGNRKLDKDPHYRLHVIDCLPNVWMLDGKIITSAERLQVEHFFDDSALTEKPVWRRHGEDNFFPLNSKRLDVQGIHGDRTEHWMKRFPLNRVLNVDVDRRRVQYLAHTLQTDLAIEYKAQKRNISKILEPADFLEKLLEARQGGSRIQCNMLILLLAASLEFAIPTHLMHEVLKCTRLHSLFSVDTMGVFLLPREVRLNIVGILLSAVKVDKDVGEEGGVYDKLYLCMYNLLSDLLILSRAVNNQPMRSYYKLHGGGRDGLRSLLACEVVQLMCIVPTYFDYITRDAGVMNITAVAAGNVDIIMTISQLIKRMEHEAWEAERMYQTLSEVVLQEIHRHTSLLINSGTPAATNMQDAFILNTCKALPRRPRSSPIHSANLLMKGRSTPSRKVERIGESSNSGVAPPKPPPPPRPMSAMPRTAALGDEVLLGPQNMGRIISMPETNVCLVQMDQVPADSGAMVSNNIDVDEHFAYVDLEQLIFDQFNNYWRPNGTVGDRITIQMELDDLDSTQDGGGAGSQPILLSTSARGGDRARSSRANTPDSRTPAPTEIVNIFQGPPPPCSPREDEMPVSARMKKQLALTLKMEAHQKHLPPADLLPPLPEKALAQQSDEKQQKSLPRGIYDTVQTAMQGLTQSLQLHQPCYATTSEVFHCGEDSARPPTAASGEMEEEDEILFQAGESIPEVSRSGEQQDNDNSATQEEEEDLDLLEEGGGGGGGSQKNLDSGSAKADGEDEQSTEESKKEEEESGDTGEDAAAAGQGGSGRDDDAPDGGTGQGFQGDSGGNEDAGGPDSTKEGGDDNQRGEETAEDQDKGDSSKQVGETDGTSQKKSSTRIIEAHVPSDSEAKAAPSETSLITVEIQSDASPGGYISDSATFESEVFKPSKRYKTPPPPPSSQQSNRKTRFKSMPLTEEQSAEQAKEKLQITNALLQKSLAKIEKEEKAMTPPPPPTDHSAPLRSRTASPPRTTFIPYSSSSQETKKARAPMYNLDQRPTIPGHHPQMHPLTDNQHMHRLILDDRLAMFRLSPRITMKKAKKTGASGEDISPPPQRPCSPAAATRPLGVKRTDKWLGGGKNLHYEVAREQRCQTARHSKPGWMEGMPSRPKSAAAVRAQSRTKTPAIVTPSSAFCDSLKGRGVIDFCPDAPYQRSMDYNAYQPAYSPLRSRGIQLRRPHNHLPGLVCVECKRQVQQLQQQQQQQPDDEDEARSTDEDMMRTITHNNYYYQTYMNNTSGNDRPNIIVWGGEEVNEGSWGDNNINQNGAMQNGVMQNGASQNGASQNGASQNGASQNGVMQNVAMKNKKMQNGQMQNKKISTTNGVSNDVVIPPFSTPPDYMVDMEGNVRSWGDGDGDKRYVYVGVLPSLPKIE